MPLLTAAVESPVYATAIRLRDSLANVAGANSEQEIGQALDQYLKEPISLAILGRVKRGKSTLINALLGRTDDVVAPIDRLPASSAISRFQWSETEAAVVHFREGRKEPVPFARIREFATEEGNPENQRGVESLEIRGPFPRLERELEIVDTPGAGSLHEHHDALVHAYIPHVDAVIFLVSARMPIDQEELELLRALKSQDIQKVFFAMNRVDEATETDLADAEAHNSKMLSAAGIAVGKLHRISAKRAFQGQWEQSGVPSLLQEISDFLSKHKRQVLENRLRQRVLRVAEPVVLRLQAEAAFAKKSSAELAQEKDRLSLERGKLTRERQTAASEFRLKWNRALLDYEQALRQAESKTQTAVQTEISSSALTQISRLAKQLPTIVQAAIDRSLADPTRRLEAEMLSATEKLEASYPSLGEFYAELTPVRADSTVTLAKGVATTAAAVTAGSGLLAAGTTAAASIAAANAAAAAATTTVLAPSAATGLLSTVPYVGSLFASITTGTATVSAPAAFTATPLWVALAGPIGWTLIGVGVLAVPFAWRISKLRTKDQLESAAKEQVAGVFSQLRENRVHHLRQLAESIVEEFELRLDRELGDLEETLEKLIQRPADSTEASDKANLATELRANLQHLQQAS
jgi:predicted GTPase